MVRALGKSPTSSFPLCSVISDCLGLLSGYSFDFTPPEGMRISWLVATVCCSPRLGSDCRISWSDYQVQGSTPDIASKGTGWAFTPSDRTRLTRWTVGVQNAFKADYVFASFSGGSGGSAGGSGPSAGERPVKI